MNTIVEPKLLQEIDRVEQMQRDLAEHYKQFPLTLDDCRNVDFHFNKKHIEHDFVPMWALKAKGKTYYVHHVESRAPWTTRETPDHPATKGAIRFKACSVSISADGIATIS